MTLLGFMYGYHGSEVYCIGLFLITCKLGIASAYINAFIAVIYMHKTRVQGTALGLCIAFGNMLAIFVPIIAKYDPIWIPMTILAVFAFTGSIVTLMLSKSPKDMRQDTEYSEDDVKEIMEPETVKAEVTLNK